MAYELQTQISGTERQLNANACAGFTRSQLWRTLYDSKQHHPSGRHINQSPPDRLPAGMEEDRLLGDGDFVAWETLGFRHASIAEDWPVLPTKSDQLTLKPRHFFNRNPAIDLAEFDDFESETPKLSDLVSDDPVMQIGRAGPDG